MLLFKNPSNNIGDKNDIDYNKNNNNNKMQKQIPTATKTELSVTLQNGRKL